MISKKPKIKIIALIKFMLKIFVAMFITIMILWLIDSTYSNIRTYQGYCTWDEERMGKRFTTQERLDIAINSYLQDQALLSVMEIDLAENKTKRSKGFFTNIEKRFTLIPYNNKEEFIKENPNCCERTWGLAGFGFWERIDGIGDGMFIFQHKIRYIDKETEDYREILSKQTYYQVNNCGYARSLSLL
ncbi:hypothetical protein RBA71_06745 [Brenneria goodwinii]|uniref:hypothetical protein n=1 Tax=Brenneria goodwinii TaxID=1109412 RepID=UPI0036EBC3F7